MQSVHPSQPDNRLIAVQALNDLEQAFGALDAYNLMLNASLDQGIPPEIETLGELQTAISAHIRAHYHRADPLCQCR